MTARQRTSEQIDKVQSDHRNLVLVIGVEVRQMVARPPASMYIQIIIWPIAVYLILISEFGVPSGSSLIC